MLRRLIPLIYLAIGVVIAAHDGYLAHLNSVGSVASALLAVVLWPLVLLGIRMTLK
jgi:hypothetical protein